MKKYLSIVGVCFFISCLSLGFFRFYIEKTKSRKADLVFTDTHQPMFYTSLGPYKGHFIIDTGLSCFVELEKDLIHQISDYELIRSKKLYSYNYTPMEHNEFFVKKIIFFGIKFKGLLINESVNNKYDYITISQEAESAPWVEGQHVAIEKYCCIGHEFLMMDNFLLDFKNDIFRFFRKDIIPIFSYPYFGLAGDNIIEFEYHPNYGLTCYVDTSIGKKKMLIDTGFTVSVFKLDDSTKDLIKQSSPDYLPTVDLDYFYVGGHDYGHTKIHILEDLKFTFVDGVLGMDFFHDKVLFFDSQKQKIYVKN